MLRCCYEQAAGETVYFVETPWSAVDAHYWGRVLDPGIRNSYPSCFSKDHWEDILRLPSENLIEVVKRAVASGDCQQAEAVIKSYQKRFGTGIIEKFMCRPGGVVNGVYVDTEQSTRCELMSLAVKGTCTPRFEGWHLGDPLEMAEENYCRDARFSMSNTARRHMVDMLAGLGVPACGETHELAIWNAHSEIGHAAVRKYDEAMLDLVMAGAMAVERWQPGFGPFPLQTALSAGRERCMDYLTIALDEGKWGHQKLMLASTGMAIAVAAARMDAYLLACEATLASQKFSSSRAFEQLIYRDMPSCFVQEGDEEGSLVPVMGGFYDRWYGSRNHVENRLRAAQRMFGIYDKCVETLLPRRLYSPKAQKQAIELLFIAKKSSLSAVYSTGVFANKILPHILIDIGVVPKVPQGRPVHQKHIGALGDWGFNEHHSRSSYPEPIADEGVSSDDEELPPAYEPYAQWGDWMDEVITEGEKSGEGGQRSYPVKKTIEGWGVVINHQHRGVSRWADGINRSEPEREEWNNE